METQPVKLNASLHMDDWLRRMIVKECDSSNKKSSDGLASEVVGSSWK